MNGSPVYIMYVPIWNLIGSCQMQIPLPIRQKKINDEKLDDLYCIYNTLNPGKTVSAVRVLNQVCNEVYCGT